MTIISEIEDKYGIQRGQLASCGLIAVGGLEMIVWAVTDPIELSPFILALGMTTACGGILRTFYIAYKHDQASTQNSVSETELGVSISKEPPVFAPPSPSSKASSIPEVSTAETDEQVPINSSKGKKLC